MCVGEHTWPLSSHAHPRLSYVTEVHRPYFSAPRVEGLIRHSGAAGHAENYQDNYKNVILKIALSQVDAEARSRTVTETVAMDIFLI